MNPHEMTPHEMTPRQGHGSGAALASALVIALLGGSCVTQQQYDELAKEAQIYQRSYHDL